MHTKLKVSKPKRKKCWQPPRQSILGWQPEDSERYKAELDMKLAPLVLESRLLAKEACLSKELADLEQHVRETAMKCHKLQNNAEETFIGDLTRDLIQRRRHLMDRGDDQLEINKLIQKCIKQDVRNKKASIIQDILKKFQGLKRITDIRTHSKRHHITAVANSEGALQEDPKSIADAFATFYEQLYSSRAPGQTSGVGDGTRQDIPTVTIEELHLELKYMRKKKA